MKSTSGNERGFSLIELLMGLATLGLVLGATAQAIKGIEGLSASGGVETEVAVSGNQAVRRIVADLKQTAFVNVGGLEYPHVFDNGNPGLDFIGHGHAAPEALTEYPGPAVREIIFRLPADADADGVPDLDGAGEIAWDPAEYSYVLVTGPDGVNQLQRRVDGGEARVIARYVDRLIIDNAITSGFEIPLNTLRVRIDMARPDSKRGVHRLSLQGIVRARNGGIVK